MQDLTDAITVVVEDMKRSWLRDTLVTLREELRSDPYAIAFWCEFQPTRAENLIAKLIEELADGH